MSKVICIMGESGSGKTTAMRNLPPDKTVFTLVNDANKYRDDLTVIFIAHSETDKDDAGYSWTRIKTNGKKLNKICLESKLTTVLLAIKAAIVDGEIIKADTWYRLENGEFVEVKDE